MRQHNVDIDRLHSLVDSFSRSKVTVIGDIIVDHYIWGKVKRISPEAPVPVVEVKEENRRLGGAANVAHNIRKLGGDVDIVGIIGRDEPGEWLRGRLTELGIGTGGVVDLRDRPTSIKTRVIAHSQQVVRFDREKREQLSSRASSAVQEVLVKLLKPGSIVVISDYGKGMITRPILKFMREACSGRNLKVCVDPKSMDFKVYRGFTLVTPNQQEAEMAANMEITDDSSLKKAGFKLLEILESRALLITRGEAGMSLFADGDVVHIPTMALEVYDVTGAGDTVLAVLSMALGIGASFLEAAILANLAAGVVVAEVGTSTISADELLKSFKNVLPYVKNKGI